MDDLWDRTSKVFSFFNDSLLEWLPFVAKGEQDAGSILGFEADESGLQPWSKIFKKLYKIFVLRRYLCIDIIDLDIDNKLSLVDDKCLFKRLADLMQRDWNARSILGLDKEGRDRQPRIDMLKNIWNELNFDKMRSCLPVDKRGGNDKKIDVITKLFYVKLSEVEESILIDLHNFTKIRREGIMIIELPVYSDFLDLAATANTLVCMTIGRFWRPIESGNSSDKENIKNLWNESSKTLHFFDDFLLKWLPYLEKFDLTARSILDLEAKETDRKLWILVFKRVYDSIINSIFNSIIKSFEKAFDSVSHPLSMNC